MKIAFVAVVAIGASWWCMTFWPKPMRRAAICTSFDIRPQTPSQVDVLRTRIRTAPGRIQFRHWFEDGLIETLFARITITHEKHGSVPFRRDFRYEYQQLREFRKYYRWPGSTYGARLYVGDPDEHVFDARVDLNATHDLSRPGRYTMRISPGWGVGEQFQDFVIENSPITISDEPWAGPTDSGVTGRFDDWELTVLPDRAHGAARMRVTVMTRYLGKETRIWIMPPEAAYPLAITGRGLHGPLAMTLHRNDLERKETMLRQSVSETSRSGLRRIRVEPGFVRRVIFSLDHYLDVAGEEDMTWHARVPIPVPFRGPGDFPRLELSPIRARMPKGIDWAAIAMDSVRKIDPNSPPEPWKPDAPRRGRKSTPNRSAKLEAPPAPKAAGAP
jgi:hypothetical protein